MPVKKESLLEKEEIKNNSKPQETKPEKEETEVKGSNKKEDKDNNYIKVSDEEKLLRQIENEYRIAKAFSEPIFKKDLLNMKLYNNQKRDPKAIGDPLLFTTMSTLHAATYDDRLTIKWLPVESGDVKQAENINMLCQYDYSAMEKAAMDNQMLWDMFFYSYGIVELVEFDREKMLPVHKLVDPATFLYDPQGATFKPGDEQMRFNGNEFLITKPRMEELGVYRNIDDIRQGAERHDRVSQAVEARQELQGGQANTKDQEEDLGENNQYKGLLWRTNFDGMKIRVELFNERKLIGRIQEIKDDNWGLTSKHCWPIAHQFRGVSVPDMTEDKQRKRSVIQNLGIKALQAQVYPRFVYDPDKIRNKADLKFGLNKHIPATGGIVGALDTVRKDSPDMNFYSYMMEMMDGAAQRATATPEIQQGVVSKEQRTLGELNLVAQRVDTRYQLIVKNVMSGDKDYWRQWYMLYKRHFKEGISEKSIRLAGLKNGEFRKLTRENIITKVDPDIRIESKILTDAANMRKSGQFMQVLQVAGEDPTADRRWAEKHLAQLSGMNEDEINDFFPPTLDEMIAENQNIMLNEDEPVPVKGTDNHIVHIQIHNKANATKATIAHIETHKQAMLVQQQNPDFYEEEQGTAEGEMGSQPGDEGAVSGRPVTGQRNANASDEAKLSQNKVEQIRA